MQADVDPIQALGNFAVNRNRSLHAITGFTNDKFQQLIDMLSGKLASVNDVSHAIIQQIFTKNVIGKGEIIEVLYLLQNQENEAQVHAISIQKWHQRLGHPSQNKIKLLDCFLPCDKSSSLNICFIWGN